MISKEKENPDPFSPYQLHEPSECYFDHKQEIQEKIRVFLIDPLALERAGLQMLIAGDTDLLLTGGAGDIETAQDLADSLQPDIVVMTLSETTGESLNHIHKISQAFTEARIILLMRSADTEMYVSAVKNGAMGVVLKTQPPETLLKAIRKVHEGEAWLDHTTVAAVLSSFSRNPPTACQEEWSLVNQLTQREREIVKMIGQGLNTHKIAKRLFMSESTIRHHLTSIYEKVGVTSRLELLIFAYRTGLEHSST